MKIAFDPDVIRYMSITDMVHQIKEWGFNYIEQSPHPQILPFYKHPKAGKEIIDEYKKVLKETGVQISSMIPIYNWSHPEENRRQAAVTNWKRAIEIAIDLGVPVMNTELAGDIKRPVESEESLYRSMEELLPIFEREGIRLDIQSHPYDFCEDGNETVDIVKSFRSDYVKYLYCAAHTFFYDKGKGDVPGMLDYAGDDLKHVIIADTMNQELNCRYIVNPPGSDARRDVTVHQHLGIGEGDVNFEAMFAKLREMDFGKKEDTIASVSLFGFPEKMAKQAPEHLARVKKELL
jgi:myo-inositol catabolism protein IolH